MVKTGYLHLLVMSRWYRRLTFHMRVESCLTSSGFHGPQQPVRRDRKRWSGRIPGKEGRSAKGKRRILQSIGRAVIFDGRRPEHRGQVVREDLAWGGGGRGGTILLLLRPLRSVNRCKRLGQSAQQVRRCRREKGRGKVRWFREHYVRP